MNSTDMAPGDEARLELAMAIVAWIRGDDLERFRWRTGLGEDDAREAIHCFFAGAVDGLAGFMPPGEEFPAPSMGGILPLFTTAGRQDPGR